MHSASRASVGGSTINKALERIALYGGRYTGTASRTADLFNISTSAVGVLREHDNAVFSDVGVCGKPPSGWDVANNVDKAVREPARAACGHVAAVKAWHPIVGSAMHSRNATESPCGPDARAALCGAACRCAERRSGARR